MKKIYHFFAYSIFSSQSVNGSVPKRNDVKQVGLFAFQHYFITLILIFLGLLSTQAYAQCDVSIDKVTVSGCYFIGGQSKATVSVEVAWSGAPANDSIRVQLGTQIRYIKPGRILVAYPQPPTYAPGFLYGHQVIVSPQVVSFQIDADGTPGSISAAFVGNPSCSATSPYAAPAACQPIVCGVNQLGGTVYRDFNSNGNKDNAETSGVADIGVTAIDCAGAVYGPVKTDASGKYAFNSASIKYPVRIEFSGLTGLNSSTIWGTGNATTVQFIEQATCDANLGIINPLNYCQDNVNVFLPCYVYGDPLVFDNTANSSGNADVLVSIPYGVNSNTFAGMAHMAAAKEIGTVWGLGYNRFTKDLFLAANLHRHSGLGPLGLGGIYVTHTSGGSYTTEDFVDVAADLNINVGSIPANNSVGRGLISDKTKPSVDSAAFYKIGKVGIGGLEVAEDGSKLWFTNLHDKKLYSMNISAYNSSHTKPTAADVQSYTLPDPGCVGGEVRPWAVKVYDNKVYVGLVCDAYTSQNKSNLRAYVYALSGNTFSQVFDFPLTYPKGYGISPLNSTGAAGVDSTGWYAWTDNFKKMVIPISNNPKSLSLVRPQPILSDIDFDIDGSMVLGFADRTGIQGGFDNYPPTGVSDTLYKVNPASGDILRAFFSNGTYILENNGQVGPATGVGQNNNQGPGFGEFYDDNYNDGTKYAHTELALGGLALKPGSGQVLGTTIDPFKASPNSGGVKVWNNTTGHADNSYVVYNASAPGTFAKASGLGEPDLNCDILTTLEIGNRVWIDTDRDGVQGACEKALKDVNVSLYKGVTLIATTKTNTNGEYYFSSKSKIVAGTWSGTGADTILLPTTAYKLVVGSGQMTTEGDTLKIAGLGKFLLTQKDATANTGNDLNDSDAAKTSIAGGNYPTIEVTTGVPGTVDHTFDAGFYCLFPADEKIVVTPATCTGLTANNDAKIKVTGFNYTDKYSYSKGPVFTGAAYAAATTVTSDSIVISGLANPTATADTFVVRLYNGICCYKDTTIILQKTTCAKGSIGDLVWKDANDNGIQDLPSEKGVKGVIIQLLNSTNNAVLSTDTTDANGIYGFPNLASGSYKVKIVLSSLSDTCQLSPKQDVNTGGGNDTNDSDFNPTTGESPVIVINTSGTGIAKDNPTIDAGLYVPCLKPVADADVTVCQGTLTVNLKDAGTGEVWSKGSQPANTSASINAATGVVTGLSSAGNYYFILTYKGQAACSDTVKVTVTPRPIASITLKKQDICVGQTPQAFIASPNTGVSYVWFGPLADSTSSFGTAINGQTSNTFLPTAPTITTLGVHYFAVVITDNATTCKDTAFVQLVVNAKPNAGNDITGGNAICNTIGTVDLPNAANGETWSQLGSTPKAVTINASTGVVTGMDVVGTYQFILKNATTGCADTLAVETKNCLKGSIGDFIWKDINDNGIQEQGEPGVKGVIVQLLNSTNNAVLATDTTDANGIYSFTGLDSGNYKVKIVLSSLPDTCQITPKQDVSTGGGTDTNDSDFNPTTGESPVIVINTLATGIAKDNPTIDAGLIIPCVKPLWNFTTTPVCSPTATVYSVAFSIANKKGHLKVNAGTLSGSNPYTVTGIPNGTNLIITDSLRANCKYDTTIIAPDCSCPQVNLLTPNATACKGDTLPTLKITLIGANTNGVNVNWFANATGGNSLASGLSYKPAGSIAATDTFFVELSGGTGGCINQPRTAIIVTALDCQVDLALKKLINKKIAQVGDTLTYTVKVWNEFSANATGVEVTDSIATTVQFVNGSFSGSRGTASMTNNVIKWTIGNIAANGDTVTLTYKVKAVQEGVHFNTAEITKTNEKDKDSTPGNGKDEEDDIDRQCFTVPIKLCPGEKVQASVPAHYLNVKWFKAGTEIVSLAGRNTVLLQDTGTYTFTSSNNTCPLEGCCPVVIEPGINCCPEDLCIPFTIKKTKKK
ncbi:SdrD B-like domain-containing protein [Runella sp.]|uniref:SdrD B-like domain-containing protein n=1 Tax=Runella sp. TaxID=1960881 RepID=UPI003D0D42F4